MGLLDGVKNFVGGKSMVTIEPTSIEREPPERATFSLRDSVLKGQFIVRAEKDCTVLAHIHELCISNGVGGGTPAVIPLHTDREDHTKKIIGRAFDFPYNLTKGQTQRGSFLIDDIDIPATLQRLFAGADPNESLANPAVKFLVRITVDVKGSPFDPSIDVPLIVLPG